MKNIHTIVVTVENEDFIEYCGKINIRVVPDINSVSNPKGVLVVHHSNELGELDISKELIEGFTVGTYLTEARHTFQGLPEYGLQLCDVYIGIINLTTGEIIQWNVPDTYAEERKAWVKDHAGQICSSCGETMDEDRDFSHGCSQSICYMCS